MKRIPLWIDADPGVDDAMMLAAACASENIDIKGLSVVAGNAQLQYTFRNGRNILSLLGREDVPVYAGADAPLLRPLKTGEAYHGKDGLAGYPLKESEAPVQEKKAWDALKEAADQENGELVLLTAGPLTNIAKAFILYPELKKMIRRIVMMGGAAQGGNVTPCAEFNVYADPEAACAVFESGVPIVMHGLDVTMKAWLTKEEMEKVFALDNPVTRLFEGSSVLCRKLYQDLLGEYLCLHDVCPLFWLEEPEMFVGQKAWVDVETLGEITLGKTVNDLWSDKKMEPKNVLVILEVDRERFVNRFIKVMEKYG